MNVTERVRGILLRPRQEWPVIDGETTDVATLYRSYIAPLAAIGPIATLIGTAVFGISVPFLGSVRVPLGTAITQAVVSYVLTLVGTYVFAFVVDILAPTFAGTRNLTQALKVVAYSSTAAWVVAVVNVVPTLSFVGLLGLYSLYLLYLGLPVLMKSPPDKTVPYIIACIVVGIVIFFVIGAITGGLFAAGLAR